MQEKGSAGSGIYNLIPRFGCSQSIDMFASGYLVNSSFFLTEFEYVQYLLCDGMSMYILFPIHSSLYIRIASTQAEFQVYRARGSYARPVAPLPLAAG